METIPLLPPSCAVVFSLKWDPGNCSVKCLLYKHEDLHSILRTNVKLGMVAHTCNPSTGEAERQNPAAHWPGSLDSFMSFKPV